GALANTVKEELEQALAAREQALAEEALAEQLQAEAIDVTLPGRPVRVGHPHPLQQGRREIEDICLRMGFSIATGPEVETDEYNFELLNIPQDHPAREMQDSFYLTPDILLRTHTSPVQIRHMRERSASAEPLPVRIIAPG